MRSAFQVSAGIAKYGIHLGQHQFNRFFAQNGSIRELAKELVQANTVKFINKANGAQDYYGDMMDGVEMFLQKYHMCVKIVM